MTGDMFDLTIARLRTGTPEIALETDYGEVDLHNFASFERFSFSSNGTAQISWAEYEPNEFTVGAIKIKQLLITFLNVSCANITPHDPTIPDSENDRLEYFVVSDEPDQGSLQLLFVFGNGRHMKITASGLQLSALRR